MWRGLARCTFVLSRHRREIGNTAWIVRTDCAPAGRRRDTRLGRRYRPGSPGRQSMDLKRIFRSWMLVILLVFVLLVVVLKFTGSDQYLQGASTQGIDPAAPPGGEDCRPPMS